MINLYESLYSLISTDLILLYTYSIYSIVKYIIDSHMLTDLFQEDDESPAASAPPESKDRISVARANPPRNETNLCGLANQGATCYLNALLQTLHFTPEFRQELFKLGPVEIGYCPADTNKVHTLLL